MNQNLNKDRQLMTATYYTAKANDANFAIYDQGVSLEGIMDLCRFYENENFSGSSEKISDAFYKVRMFIQSARNELEKIAADFDSLMFQPDLLRLLKANDKTSVPVNDEV